MRKQNILRALLFAIFFSIGAAALCGSILCDELLQYYTNKQLLKVAEESLTRLESLNIDYDLLLQQLEKDPNLVKRIASATLGTQPADANTIYPRVTVEQLATARKALTEDSNRQHLEPMVSDRLMRCSGPAQRVILFLAGAFLILISFICFSPAEQRSYEE